MMAPPRSHWSTAGTPAQQTTATARTTTIDLVDFRGDDAEHEALLRRPAHKYRPGRRRRHVQVRRCSPLRREPLLRQALLEDSPAWRVADAQEGGRKAAEDRPDHGEASRRRRQGASCCYRL